MTRGVIRFDEVGEIGGCKAVEGFVSQEANFVGYALVNGKPVKFMAKGSDVVGSFDRRIDKTDKRVLSELQAMNRVVW